ncbi:MAG: hypothetical protein ABR530_05235 [Pyrinomonadaceae bacterium]
MRIKAENVCEWSRCYEPAANHVRFGMRVFDIEPDIHVSDQSFNVDHKNFCSKHVARIQDEYFEVTVMQLGGCEIHRLIPGEAANAASNNAR